MSYTIELRPAALRDLKRPPKEVLDRVSKKINSLADNPRPAGNLDPVIRFPSLIEHLKPETRLGILHVFQALDDILQKSVEFPAAGVVWFAKNPTRPFFVPAYWNSLAHLSRRQRMSA